MADPSTVTIILMYSYATLAAITIIHIMALLNFVVDETVMSDSAVKHSFTTGATPFNVSLFLALSGLLTILIGQLCYIGAINSSMWSFGFVAADAGVAVLDMGYIQYIWARGFPIIEATLPKATPYLKRIVQASPLLFALLPVPSALVIAGVKNEFLATYGGAPIAIICGLLVVSFDCLIGITFVRYRATTGLHGDKRLEIVTRYGIAAACIGIVALCVFVVGFAVAADAPMYQCFVLGTFALLVVECVILFWMKVAIRRCRLERASLRTERAMSVVGTSWNSMKF
ncbi:hypothetical protein BC830DRAFT_118510 [Chytriomyces sp. MP71]|nr:hypothetical protein BC830DRAFT_118510 [Chytriomyces sp. MP71]